MLTQEEARKKGIRACIEKIGYEFCKKYADNATSAYGMENGMMNCFVGVNDSPAPDFDISKVTELVLSSDDRKWRYSASCNVDMQNGKLEFLKCVLPERNF